VKPVPLREKGFSSDIFREYVAYVLTVFFSPFMLILTFSMQLAAFADFDSFNAAGWHRNQPVGLAMCRCCLM
jgi:hypothetical protein